ncbi:LipL45 protein [Chitinispirillum alkaliphilum]|nr:LipL45 protein [Chitinispirillum alkaliphilum]
MKLFRVFQYILCCLFLITARTEDTASIQHYIRRGESISLICIDYYGHYTRQMGTEIMSLNPWISDINVIEAGKTLRLPRPQNAAASTTPSATPEKSAPALFERNLEMRQGVITCVEGRAYIMRQGSEKRETLLVNSIVSPGDIIETDSDGRVEIIINRESVCRIRENSRVVLDAFRDPGSGIDQTNMSLDNGTVWTRVKRVAGRLRRFELSLPTAIAGVHGTVYQAAVHPDSSSEVKVYSGEVKVERRPEPTPQHISASEVREVSGPHEIRGPHEVSMEEWVRIVQAMQKVYIGRDGVAENVSGFARDPQSCWERWNEERDLRIAEIFGE